MPQIVFIINYCDLSFLSIGQIPNFFRRTGPEVMAGHGNCSVRWGGVPCRAGSHSSPHITCHMYKAGFQKTGLFEKNLASENCRPYDRPWVVGRLWMCLKGVERKIFINKPIIFTALKVLWQTFYLARPKILDWAWKQYHPSTPTSTKNGGSTC